MNCWKTKYGYNGTSVDLCHTYYMNMNMGSMGDGLSPYTFSECYRDGDNCRRNSDTALHCSGPPPPPEGVGC